MTTANFAPNQRGYLSLAACKNHAAKAIFSAHIGKYLAISISIGLLLGTIGTADAALSATTANTIKGTKPFIKFNGVQAMDLNVLLSFDMPDGSGGTTTIDPTVTTAISADKTWTFNQFTTKVTADGVNNNLATVSGVAYADDDDDLPHATTPIAGTLTATWSYVQADGTTKTLTAGDLSGNFDACNAPYTLSIAANSVKAQSSYGDPIDNNYGSSSKSYTVNVKEYKFCYAKPNQMNVYPGYSWESKNGSSWSWNGSSTIDPSDGGGYSLDFIPGAGFKADAATKFPTTGFVGAQFDLVMSNAQSDYTYTSSQAGAVSVDTAGTVKLLSKPAGNVTITATPTNPSYPAVTYSFNPTTVWAIPKTGKYTWALAQTQCGGAANVLTRKDLTNSPRNTAPMGLSLVINYYTRAIGGGVFGEWGYSSNGTGGTYPDSQWVYQYYWTQDVHNTGTTQFLVSAANGYVNAFTIGSYSYVACRG